MLKELTAVISDDNTNIRGVDTKQSPDGEAMVEFVVEAEDLRHLNKMVLGLRRVAGVRTVQRTWPRSCSDLRKTAIPYGSSTAQAAIFQPVSSLVHTTAEERGDCSSS